MYSNYGLAVVKFLFLTCLFAMFVFFLTYKGLRGVVADRLYRYISIQGSADFVIQALQADVSLSAVPQCVVSALTFAKMQTHQLFV